MRVVICGSFPGLNEYIAANRIRRGNWSKGNAMKQRDQGTIAAQLPNVRFNTPIYIRYSFYCKDKKRDKDNISSYFHKVFQDALVEKGVIPNDGWKEISGFEDRFFVDPRSPRVEVDIVE